MLSTDTYLHRSNNQHLQPYQYAATDNDELRDPPSLSSSPVSQNSAIYQTGPESQAPYAKGASLTALAVPRSIASLDPAEVTRLNLGHDLQLMNSDDWSHAGGPFRPKLLTRGDHNRDSSLSSSLGSIGPTSPYSHGAITPRIAIADAGHDGFPSMADFPHETMWTENYPVDSKPPTSSHASEQYFPALVESQGSHPMHYLPTTMPQGRGLDRPAGLAPPIDFQSMSRHGPESVASSTIGGDSPATPALGEPLEERRRTDGGEYKRPPKHWFAGDLQSQVFREVPKFERSITDACQDSIYAENMAVGSSSPSQQHFSPSKVFSRAVEAANKEAAKHKATTGGRHLNVGNPPSHALRGSSPFRNGSPLAPVSGSDFPQRMQYAAMQSGAPHDGSAANIKGESSIMGAATGTSQTISPKDAMLELDDADAPDDNYALFPSQPPSYPNHHDQLMGDTALPGGQFHYMAHPSATDVRVPQQYPFIPSSMPVGGPRQFPSSPTVSGQEQGLPRPATDDGGTYSCTYHGCELRFDSQKELQSHKREGHRAAGVSRRGDRGQSQQTQHGPHICMRKNPSTNKPCGSKFSRPYDLTRHEDTIHNANKKKLRCRICPEEKLFSRRDALNRHFKVCHEELYETEFPRRRRANRP